MLEPHQRDLCTLAKVSPAIPLALVEHFILFGKPTHMPGIQFSQDTVRAVQIAGFERVMRFATGSFKLGRHICCLARSCEELLGRHPNSFETGRFV